MAQVFASILPNTGSADLLGRVSVDRTGERAMSRSDAGAGGQEGGTWIRDEGPDRPRPLGLFFVAAWLGLAAGAMELSAFLLLRGRAGVVWPYLGRIRHYPVTIPLVDAALILMLAAPIALLLSRWPRTWWHLGLIILLAGAMTPTLMIIVTGIYMGSLFLVALGVASMLAPILRNRYRLVVRVARSTLPVLILALVGVAIWRGNPAIDAGRDGPERKTPNVLLIVLDTVRFDHLSIDGSGYDRPTTPILSDLARKGVSFTGARSTAPWTLPSHASLMTGRWAFEACDGRYGAMIDSDPTLAGVLAARGFDTVGIVANTFYCTYSTGLSRDFSHYEDLPLTLATVLSSSEVGGRIVDWVGAVSASVRPDAPPPLQRFARIDADSINRRFLRWLDRRPAGPRPFFAFLNYFDAHDPYLVPSGAEHRFGADPRTNDDRRFLEGWWLSPEKEETADDRIELLIDGYDSCLSYLDDRLGALFRELDRRALLDETIVVITSDHGEAFGEHELYGHGVSLFEDQIRVPLIVVAPGLVPELGTREGVVSLRDVPATILDLVDVPGPSLPGTSLARLWSGEPADPSPAIASVSGPESFPPNSGRSPVFRGPMISTTDRNALKYIKTFVGNGPGEELYNLSTDPGERVNLASPQSEALMAPLRSTIADRNESRETDRGAGP
jgi:arylsulfatase A-like enzyme